MLRTIILLKDLCHHLKEHTVPEHLTICPQVEFEIHHQQSEFEAYLHQNQDYENRFPVLLQDMRREFSIRKFNSLICS